MEAGTHSCPADRPVDATNLAEIKQTRELQSQALAARFREVRVRNQVDHEEREAPELHEIGRASANQEQQRRAVMTQAAVDDLRRREEFFRDEIRDMMSGIRGGESRRMAMLEEQHSSNVRGRSREQ